MNHAARIAAVLVSLFSNAPSPADVRLGPVIKLTPEDIGEGDRMGGAVAMDEGLAVVSAGDGFYVFDTTTGKQINKLIFGEAAVRRSFGASISLSGGIAIIGHGYDSVRGDLAGAARLFDPLEGTHIAELVPHDIAASDQFGSSVAIDGDLALVGAYGKDYYKGAAYVFDVNTGEQLTKLSPIDLEAFDHFGHSVALEDGLAIVTAPQKTVQIDGRVSVVVYVFDARTGEELVRLSPDEPAAPWSFGTSVSIDDGMTLIGAYLEEVDGIRSVGAAYLFDAKTGEQLSRLTPPRLRRDQYFGNSVVLEDEIAIVSARGSLYLHDTLSGRQSELPGFGLIDANAIDAGFESVDNGLLLVGTPRSDEFGSDSGAVHLYRIVPEPVAAALAILAILTTISGRPEPRR